MNAFTQKLIEQLINGITVGSFYALVALGYTMVYGVLSMINFAHGEVYMIGAYTGFITVSLLSNTNLYINNPIIVIIITIIAGAAGASITGVLLERLAYRPLRKAGRLAPLISAIGASLVLQELVRIIPKLGKAITSIKINENFIIKPDMSAAIMKSLRKYTGAMVKTYPGILSNNGFNIGTIFISYSRIVIVLISLAMMVSLSLLVKFSKLGKAMRAVSEDKDTAALMGINVNSIITNTFLIGSAMAGVAGVMVGMFYLQIKPTMGFVPGIKAFTAAVLGGIGSIPGAMIGGYTLGLAEVIGIQFLPAIYKDIVAFAILILTLIFKPSGIFGHDNAQKKL